MPKCSCHSAFGHWWLSQYSLPSCGFFNERKSLTLTERKRARGSGSLCCRGPSACWPPDVEWPPGTPLVCPGCRVGRVPVSGRGGHAPAQPRLRRLQCQRGRDAHARAAHPRRQSEEAQAAGRARRARRGPAHGDGLPQEEHRVRAQVAHGRHRERCGLTGYRGFLVSPVRPPTPCVRAVP